MHASAPSTLLYIITKFQKTTLEIKNETFGCRYAYPAAEIWNGLKLISKRMQMLFIALVATWLTQCMGAWAVNAGAA
jgi:hypothetical protein